MVNSNSERRNEYTELFQHPAVQKLQFSSMAWKFCLEKGSNGKMTGNRGLVTLESHYLNVLLSLILSFLLSPAFCGQKNPAHLKTSRQQLSAMLD